MASPDISPTLYAAGTQLIRALLVGEDAFFACLDEVRDVPPADLLRFGERHRVMPWLAQLADHPRSGEALGGPVCARLRDERVRQQRWIHKLVAQCEEIQAGFHTAGLDCLFLKGLAFGSRLYGDPRLRPQWDVDVLVRREQLPAALGVLGPLGYAVETNSDNQRPAQERLAEIAQRPQQARHAIGVKRGGQAVDLHWTVRRRLFSRLDHEHFFANRQPFEVDGRSFETLGDEDALVFLLVGICGDLKRGAGRARQQLDLHLLLRDLGAFDWTEFLARRRSEGLLALTVNVLALHLEAWQCHSDHPGLREALEPHRPRLAFRGREAALVLLTQPRHSATNRAWFRRVYPRSGLRRMAWNLGVDLPHNLLRRLAPPHL